MGMRKRKKKKKYDPYSKAIHKINSRWIKDQMWEYLYNSEMDKSAKLRHKEHKEINKFALSDYKFVF